MKHWCAKTLWLLIPTLLWSDVSLSQKRSSAKIRVQESYSIIRSNKTKVGFAISRYQFHKKNKRWIFTSYTKTNSLAGDITEKLTAISDQKLKPLSFFYEGSSPGKKKTLRASFKKNKMRLTQNINGQKKTIRKTLPQGAFLSSFLNYMIFQNRKQAKPGFRFSYNAIAEEDGQIYLGSSYIKDKEAYKGLLLYRVITDFKKSQVTSLISPQAEAIYALSPVQKISVEMAAEPPKALEGINHNPKEIKALFGELPKGLKNSLSPKKTVHKRP